MSGPGFSDTAFAVARHLLVSRKGDGFGTTDEAPAKLGLPRRLRVVLPQMYAAPALVARTDLVATLMECVVTGSGMMPHLAVGPCPVELSPVAFHLLWHRRSDRHPAQGWLRHLPVSLAPRDRR